MSGRLGTDADGVKAQFANVIGAADLGIQINNATATKLRVDTGNPRKQLIIQIPDTSPGDVYIGFDANVSPTVGVNLGMKMAPGAGFIQDVTENIDVYAITSAGTFYIYVAELR